MKMKFLGALRIAALGHKPPPIQTSLSAKLQNANAMTRQTPSRFANSKAVSCEANKGSPAQRSGLGLPEPRPNGWSSDFSRKSSHGPEANPVQKKIVGKLYSTLESSLDDEDDQQQKKKASFRQLLRIAEKASVWQAWPFASMQDDEDNLVTVHHNLSDLLFRAYHAGKVPQVLGLLHMLFKVLPPCSTTTSPHLLDVMDLLAEIKQSPGTPSSCSKKIGQMLLPWVQTLQQVVSDKSLGTAQPADSSAAVSSDMQQQSSPATAFSSSAVQQTPGIAPASHESLSAIEQAQQGLLSLAPSALNTILPKEEDLSPAGVEAYNLVAALSDADFPQEPQPSEKWKRHRAILGSLGAGPHGKFAIQEYMQRHTNVFHFDFNKEATRRFRESQESQEEATSDEPDVPSYILTDPSLILRMGMDVGFKEEDSSADQDGGKDQEGGDPYV